MKVPFEWLQEFVVIKLDPQELAKRLTMRGLEVEGLETITPSFKGVIAATIKSVEKHPNADNLSVCVVNTGKEDLTIVCGAKNIAAGQKVPLATVGAELKEGFVVDQRKLRGIESFGMLCSEKELGLSDDHSGIFILPEDVHTGSDLARTSWIQDAVLDINVTPNRGDCLSIFGIAREVASILHQKAKLPQFKIAEDNKENVVDHIGLDIKDIDACPRYVLKMIRGTSIIPSPFWMRNRLIKCGMRPINSLVDVTNYVMLELGQPLHAFDYNRLAGKRIEARLAEKPGVFRTLDSVERAIEAGDTLICDGNGPVAIAGIMGGENSEITAETRDMALESAYFNPLYIRKTARRLGIRSEASLRFEKGIDIDNVGLAAERAAYLMQSIAGGTVLKGDREIYKKSEPRTVLVPYRSINGLLGTHIRQQEIIKCLRSIDLHIKEEEDHGLRVTIPHFRHDVVEAADIIEEISRIYGYDHIPATSPATVAQPQKKTQKGVFLDTAKTYAVAAGFYELRNFAFFSPNDIEGFRLAEGDERTDPVGIMNPISKEFSHMRTMLSPGVLRSMAYNLNRGAKNLRLFEEGKVFFKGGEKTHREMRSICFAMTGKEREFFWRESPQAYDFFDMKGIVEGLLDSLHSGCTVQRTTEPFLHPTRSADVYIDGVKAGWIGEITEEVLKVFDIEEIIYCAELYFDIILEKGNMAIQYKPIPRFPQVTRDFAFVVDDSIPIASLTEAIKGLSPLITSVGVFDMFRKENRSVAFRVVFQSYEDTLKEEMINNLQEKIIQEITHREGISLRA